MRNCSSTQRKFCAERGYTCSQCREDSDTREKNEMLAQVLQDLREVEQANIAAFKRQGAKEALETLIADIRRRQSYSAINAPGMIQAALLAEDALKDLEVPVEAGGEFPEGYFGKEVA